MTQPTSPAMVALAVLLAGGLSGCENPAIYRAEGSVASVSARGTDLDVCLVHAVKAKGSAYGKTSTGGRICVSGTPEPAGADFPKVGDCVILQTQGEGSSLKIEKATSCAQ